MELRSTSSDRTRYFTESVIREMTRLAAQHGAVNLAQGFPDFPAPAVVKAAACEAINADINQYSITWGSESLRRAIADKYQRTYGLKVDPETQVCVTCGSTEAMMASILGLVNPGDEIIVFEPYYENYAPDALIAGASLRYVPLHYPDWSFDEGELTAAFNDNTQGIILNSPNNPTGKVFSLEELKVISRLCNLRGAVAYSDEIYEHIVYDDRRHVPMATVPGMEDRTVTINSLSKTYSVTGWRVGWAIAQPELIQPIRKVHDFLTVGAAAPLQEAGVAALGLPDDYYTQLATDYSARRAVLMQVLETAGLKPLLPQGAYYIITDVAGLNRSDDVEAARYLVESVGVAAVPLSSMYSHVDPARPQLRFAFSKRHDTLIEAGERLRSLAVQ
jgi:aspartate/methionine/tyrosine aminotransferase